nr:hypothetical protein [Tanacetum cinerariifolium]
RFEERLRLLETSFFEYRQTNQFADAVSAIPGIVHQYMDQQMKEAFREKVLKELVQDQVKEQVSRILPRIEESVNATLEAEVLTRSLYSSRTSYAIAADLSAMELKKILIEKMEGNNKSAYAEEPVKTTCQMEETPLPVYETGADDQPIVQTSQHPEWFSQPRKPPSPDRAWNTALDLAKALVEAYEADKAIMDTYEESTILKRRREDDDQEGPSAGPNRGSKRQKEGGEQASASTPSEKATKGAGGSTTGTQSRQQSATLPAAQGDAQSWISDLAKQADARSSFNEILDTPIDFSNFILHRLNVDTLTPDLLAGPTYELMRGSCSTLTELEYHLEEVYKAMTDQLDWVNAEGQQYPHNLLQPLPLKPDNRGRRVIPFEHFINNDLEYLRGGASSRKYTTSVTKTKAVDYGHIKWIEDLVPREMWIQQPIDYNKHALWGVSHWGRKRKQFYGYAVNQES